MLRSTAKSAIVAQTARIGDKRDIQVVEVEGDRYHFVGSNGGGITGVEGSMLHAAAQSPDGRLWIMAEHSRFPNQIQGNQFCLYGLEDDRWNPIGPRFGAPREHSWNQGKLGSTGLHFLSDSRPITVSIHPKRDADNPTWQTRLRRLEGDRWITVPGHEYVYDRDSFLKFLWRANDAWLIEARQKAGRAMLDARWIKGPRPEDVVGPFHLDSWPGKMTFYHFAVSQKGSVAAVGCQGDVSDIKPGTPFFVKLYHPAGGRAYKAEQVPFPPGPGHAIDIMEWSPTGALHVVRSTDEKIFVYRFTDGHWGQVGMGMEPREFQSAIMSSHLFFRHDGTPVVTWEKFIPEH
ncbi:MAG: hypothetical protein WD278_14525 [Pirellulales bacterium]